MRPALWLVLTLALARTAAAQVPAAPPRVNVVLWFDTEDYILPQDDDADLRLADMLTRLGVRATFKVVGEKARVLEQRGRTDVIAALKRHDIGYHSNTHSQQPTVAVYLQHAGWDDGIAEFTRREGPGVKDLERIFGVTPVAYGQPGSAWAPQSYPALKALGIRVYLDEADHVGLDDQPFYYDGMLNVFRMRSTLVRMALTGGTALADGKASFEKVAETLRAKGGGTISIYYHPNEWVHEEFWDAVNFSNGANPPRDQWRLPRTRPAAETEAAFRDFEQFVRFIQAEPGVRFVTATELLDLYADGAGSREYSKDDLLAVARQVGKEITFQRLGDVELSAADAFSLLTDATEAFARRGALPDTTALMSIDGPGRPYEAPAGSAPREEPLSWQAFVRAVRDVASYDRTMHRMPDVVWVGTEAMSPADYLATLAPIVESIVKMGEPPADVERRTGRLTADRYVAEDSPDLWSWPIFPKGFHAPDLMALARLQAWTLKPALLRTQTN
jgi:hypothetical protein